MKNVIIYVTARVVASAMKTVHVTNVAVKGVSMNKLLLVVVLLFAVSACSKTFSLGEKCVYTQEGTRISSWIWFTKEIPVDLNKNNCN